MPLLDILQNPQYLVVGTFLWFKDRCNQSTIQIAKCDREKSFHCSFTVVIKGFQWNVNAGCRGYILINPTRQEPRVPLGPREVVWTYTSIAKKGGTLFFNNSAHKSLFYATVHPHSLFSRAESLFLKGSSAPAAYFPTWSQFAKLQLVAVEIIMMSKIQYYDFSYRHK